MHLREPSLARDRLRWLLRRIALGLPVAPLLVMGCPSTQGLDADADTARDTLTIDAQVPPETGGGPYCRSCGTSEVSVTQRDVVERGLDPGDCMSACSSLVMGTIGATCGGGFSGWPQITACTIVGHDAADGGPSILDAADDDPGADDSGIADAGIEDAGIEDAGVEDAGLEDAAADPLDVIVARMSCEVEFCHPAGRRPAALRLARRSSGTVGRWLAEVATLEATSVPAFAELRRELRAHGAPPALVAATARAEADEVLHARLVARLARRAGATPARARVSRAAPRSLGDLLVHNAAEGCVREAYGALSALVQSQAARDPDTRRVFARIARDEARHALLSLELDAWARPRVRASERRRAEEAAALASDELRASFATDTAQMRDTLGLPEEERGRELVALCA